MQNNINTRICFTLPYRAGGVAGIVKNIIEYIDIPSSQIDVILIKNIKDPRSSIPDNFNTDKISIFEFSSLENKYSTHKRFCKLFDNNTLLITNGYFELRALNSQKKTNKVIHIIHGSQDIEFELIKKYKGIINAIVGVSKYICIKATKATKDYQIPVHQILQPVPDVNKKREENLNGILKIIFVGRFIKAKGIYDLPIIDKKLKEVGINVKWTIVGFGQEEESFKKSWRFNKNINWTGKVSNKEILKLYPKNDILILPSHSEGFPVVLIEAMKCGLVPLISDLPSGIPEIVKNGITGYKLPISEPDKYTEIIKKIHFNRSELDIFSLNALKIVKSDFNPYKQANEYKKVIANIIEKKREKKVYLKENFGFLDKPFIPNFIVIIYRKIRLK